MRLKKISLVTTCSKGMRVTKENLEKLTRSCGRVDTIFTIFPKRKKIKPTKRRKILNSEAVSSCHTSTSNRKIAFDLVTRNHKDADSSFDRCFCSSG